MIGLEGILTKEQVMFRDDIRNFVGQNLAPIAQEMYVANSNDTYKMDEGLLLQIGKDKLHGTGIPKDFDGMGLGVVERIILNEEFGYEDLSTALMFVTTGIFANAIQFFGTNAQKQKYLREIANGAVCSFFLSEPGSGSDAFGSIQTRLERKGDSYYMTGSKTWGTNGAIAKYALVFLKSEGRVKAVIVPNAALNNGHGYNDYTLIRKMGLLSSSTILVSFDNLQIPPDAVFGADGAEIARTLLYLSRLEIAAQALGAARRYIKEVQSAVKEREAYMDEPVKRVLYHKISEYIGRINVATLSLYKSAIELAKDNFEPYKASISKLAKGRFEPYKASISKFDCSEILADAANDFSSLFYGRVPFGSIADRIQRDSPVYKIFEGASEIQLNTIAETKLHLPK